MQIRRFKVDLSSESLVRIFSSRVGGFALDSTLQIDKLGDWSFYGSEPFKWINGGQDFEELRQEIDKYKFINLSNTLDMMKLPFVGGAVGFISYDYARCLESIPKESNNDLSIPSLCFGLYDQFVAKNIKSGEVFLVASEVRVSAEESFSNLEKIIECYRPIKEFQNAVSFKNWLWDTSKEDFCRSVEKIRNLIAKGDVYQVNLSRRREACFIGSTINLYCALRLGNPSPYGGYFNNGKIQLISTSPEQFLKKTGSTLVTRPIKGTRPRGKTSRADKQFEKDLIRSKKDRAELLMIVDLERNDLGKVSKYGTVMAGSEFNIEFYKSVMHATAEIRSELSDEKDIFDALNALFPGGSITGAPKIKAMEIIESLEPNQRGLYCGSFGYIGFNHDAEFNISIRSITCVRDRLYYSVGSGIVWDSIPEQEYEETEAKGKAIEATFKSLI